MIKQNFFKLAYLAIRYGDWEYGWATKKTWPEKHQFGFFIQYYDGYHWSFHCGPFYIYSYF